MLFEVKKQLGHGTNNHCRAADAADAGASGTVLSVQREDGHAVAVKRCASACARRVSFEPARQSSRCQAERTAHCVLPRQGRQPYPFKLRLTKGVKRAIERAMGGQDWQNEGAGWQGKDGQLRLQGCSRHRIVILRRRTERSLALSEHDAKGQLWLGFADIDNGRDVLGGYAVLVTSFLDRSA